MQIVLNGHLTEAEQDYCVRRVTEKVPIGLIEKLFLDADADGVSITYELKRIRELRKMTGEVIGAPEDWNYAKQAELRDMVPNSI